MSALLDRLALAFDRLFNDTGEKDRGEDRPTPAWWPKSDALESAKESQSAMRSNQM